MSPAFKQVIYTVTGAGLFFAAITCSADTVQTAQAANTHSVAASAPFTAVNESQLQSPASSPVPAAQNGGVKAGESEQAATPAIAQTTAQPSAAQPGNNPYYSNANSNSPPIGSGGHLLNVTLGLLLIIGLIFGLSWFVKRFSQGTFTGNSHLKIIATMPLGTRERIVLIDAGGQQLLLGITPTHINTLHAFDIPITTNPADASTSDFGRKLMAILQRPNTNDDSNNNNNSGARE